ncbi:Polyketide synthase-nonribosomal peptide synthetase [Colletotrichum higginsianum]|uniref:Polyketide synthase-nonribosomal peptide synthetase n=1 Tax=Colletotrichum higginsianum TaxID=80884 RepID=A0A4T0VCT6_9PEZI|nr:Polyketide synthase-nonribosomal peptide synthetase [Colletotrichum higginsianum]
MCLRSVVPGTLTHERLGLSTADAVLNNGYFISHMRLCARIRPANYDATCEIVRLALPHRFPVHYVSNDKSPSTAAPTHDPASGSWEKTCRLAPDLRASIYRPASIVHAGRPLSTAYSSERWGPIAVPVLMQRRRGREPGGQRQYTNLNGPVKKSLDESQMCVG